MTKSETLTISSKPPVTNAPSERWLNTLRRVLFSVETTNGNSHQQNSRIQSCDSLACVPLTAFEKRNQFNHKKRKVAEGTNITSTMKKTKVVLPTTKEPFIVSDIKKRRRCDNVRSVLNDLNVNLCLSHTAKKRPQKRENSIHEKTNFYGAEHTQSYNLESSVHLSLHPRSERQSTNIVTPSCSSNITTLNTVYTDYLLTENQSLSTQAVCPSSVSYTKKHRTTVTKRATYQAQKSKSAIDDVKSNSNIKGIKSQIEIPSLTTSETSSPSNDSTKENTNPLTVSKVKTKRTRKSKTSSVHQKYTVIPMKPSSSSTKDLTSTELLKKFCPLYILPLHLAYQSMDMCDITKYYSE